MALPLAKSSKSASHPSPSTLLSTSLEFFIIVVKRGDPFVLLLLDGVEVEVGLDDTLMESANLRP